jgi:hypothetical protein
VPRTRDHRMSRFQARTNQIRYLPLFSQFL